MIRHLIVVVLSALMATGCVSMSRDAKWFHGVFAGRRAKLEKSPSARKLEKHLEREKEFDQPLAYYDELRVAELQQLGSSKHTKLSEDGATGVPLIFMIRAETVLWAELQLARQRLAEGTPDAALTHAHAALARGQQQLPTRWSRAQWAHRSFQLSHEIYAAQGQPGRARAAQLQADLVADYQRSAGARDDYLDHQRLIHGDGRKVLNQTQSGVWSANKARLQYQQQVGAQIERAAAGVSAAVVRSTAQAQLQQNGGVVTPEIERAQVYADMLDTYAQRQGAISSEVVRGRLSLTAAATDIVLIQLADPQLRVDALSLIRGFAEEIPAVVGKPELREHAQRALGLVDNVKAVAKGTTEERVEAARELADELDRLLQKI